MILLPHPPKCWDYRHATSSQVRIIRVLEEERERDVENSNCGRDSVSHISKAEDRRKEAADH